MIRDDIKKVFNILEKDISKDIISLEKQTNNIYEKYLKEEKVNIVNNKNKTLKHIDLNNKDLDETDIILLKEYLRNVLKILEYVNKTKPETYVCNEYYQLKLDWHSLQSNRIHALIKNIY